MAYGSLSVEQEAILRPIIADNTVHDLGAGDLHLSRRLLTLGAKSIVAIDKERVAPKSEKIRGIQTYFHLFHDPVDIAFIAWPINHEGLGLTAILKRARIVIYLGKNTDGSSCGAPEIFEHFMTRDLMAYLPTRKNTLMVYGGALTHPRTPRGEEKAGLEIYGAMYRYEEVEPDEP